MQRRTAQLPLHGGKAPAWLFKRMTHLAEAITLAIVDEFGPVEMLRRLTDPWWFQAFGCVLGFDWHSSGVTTVTCGVLKQASKRCGDDLGILVAGGKGAVSRNTPREIADAADRLAISGGDKLIHASRMSAKVDSAAVQDGFQLYQHTFFFTPDGHWAVVQQGMNESSGWARRYHWLGEHVDDFVCEPHAAIRDLADRPDQAEAIDDRPRQLLLNMVAEEAADNRKATADLIRGHPDQVLEELKRCCDGPTLFAPKRHRLLERDINSPRLRRIIIEAHEQHPQDFAALLGTGGVGPATIRSLSLLAELIYNAPASHRDPADFAGRRFDLPNQTASSDGANSTGTPATLSADPHTRRWADYSYAHGGKDGTPFPVDRETYDQNIAILTDAVRKARLGENDKVNALRRLARHGESA